MQAALTCRRMDSNAQLMRWRHRYYHHSSTSIVTTILTITATTTATIYIYQIGKTKTAIRFESAHSKVWS